MNCKCSPTNIHLQIMDEMSASRYSMSMMVSICQHFDDQQFRYTVICTLHDVLSGKFRFTHTSTVPINHLLALKKTTRTPRVHLVTYLQLSNKCGLFFALLSDIKVIESFQ